jgi:hypothetical protein
VKYIVDPVDTLSQEVLILIWFLPVKKLLNKYFTVKHPKEQTYYMCFSIGYQHHITVLLKLRNDEKENKRKHMVLGHKRIKTQIYMPPLPLQRENYKKLS